MTNKDLKIWLINNEVSREWLAEQLGISIRTIDGWCSTKGKVPKMAVLALETVERNLALAALKAI